MSKETAGVEKERSRLFWKEVRRHLLKHNKKKTAEKEKETVQHEGKTRGVKRYNHQAKCEVNIYLPEKSIKKNKARIE